MKILITAVENILYVVGGLGSIRLFHLAVDVAEKERGYAALGGELFVAFIAYGFLYVLIKYAARKAREWVDAKKNVFNPWASNATVAVAKVKPNGKCVVTSRDGKKITYATLGDYINTMK